MLWHVVDWLAILVALAIVVVGFPGRYARRWRKDFLERARLRAQPSKAKPRRDSSSTA